jgi:N-terminal acetyltransferase 2
VSFIFRLNVINPNKYAHPNNTTGLATQLALAYAIHKSFIFIRVPLAAAITPKVVKVLRGWGWDIGKRTTKEAKAIKRSLGSKPATK